MPAPDAFPDLGPIRFRRRRDAGDVLNATVRFVRENAGELARTYLVVVLPVAIAAGASWALVTASMVGRFEDPATFGDDFEAILGAPLLGAFVFGLLGQGVAAAAASAYVRLYRRGETGALTAGALWEEARPLVLPFVGLYLLVAFAFVLTAALNLLPCLGTIAWIAFLLWLLPRVFVALAARAVEVETVAESTNRALELVKGSWGAALGALLLAFVLYYGVVLVGSIPYYVAVFVAETNAADPAAQRWLEALLVPIQVLGYAASLLPLVAAFFVHGRLVEELEGTSLYADLDALAGEAAPDRTSSAFGPRSTPPPLPTAPPDDRPSDDDPPDDRPADDSSGGFRGGGFGR